MNEVHSMLAENGAWASSGAEYLMCTALTASCTVHCGGLLEHGWELILHVVNNAGTNSLFNLLGKNSPLIFVVLQAHGRNLI